MKRIVCILLVILLCSGCKNYESVVSETQSIELESIETKDIQTEWIKLLNGCDDFIVMSGKDLLDLSVIEKKLQYLMKSRLQLS